MAGLHTADTGAGRQRDTGSIAALEQVELNGSRQWVSIRARTPKAGAAVPAGGPGGSQLAAVRSELGALEEHFVVVG